MTAGAFVRPDDLNALTAILRRSGAEVESEIRGSSMVPTLPPGARIRIACADPPDARPGDVLAFVHRGALMAHRVVARGRGRRSRNYVVTRGDAFTLCDPPVLLAAALGSVTACRAPEAVAWSPVPPAPPLRGARRWFAAADHVAMGGLLRVHPALARWVAAGVLRTMARVSAALRRLG